MQGKTFTTWIIVGLPGYQENRRRTYYFYLGSLPENHPNDDRTIELRIPEMPHRDAEGRPRYPEQAAWIREVLQENKINAQEIWWSQWQFKTPKDAERFENMLKNLGARIEEKQKYNQ